MDKVQENNRIHFLDGWRGFAILGVLFAHFLTPAFLNAGRLGVELFFVLSGRLMAEILFVKETPLPQFFLRRISRIYPALFFCVTVTFILSQTVHYPESIPLLSYISTLTLTANYVSIYLARTYALDHIWSLCIEEHLYIFLGILAAIHRRWALPLVPVLGVVFTAMILNGIYQTYALGLDYYSVYWRTDVRGASILLGALAFLSYREHLSESALLQRTWMPVLLGVAGVLLNSNSVPDPIKYSTGTACLALCLVTLHHAPVRVLRILENRFLIYFGVTSYSLYLWQQIFMISPYRHGLFPFYLATGLLSFYLIETPARKALNMLSGRFSAKDETYHPKNPFQSTS